MKEVFADVLGSMQERLQKFADLCTKNGYPTKLVKTGATKFEIVTLTPVEKPTTKPVKAVKTVKTESDKPAKKVKAVKTETTTDTIVPVVKRKPGRPKKVVENNTTE